MDEGGLWKWSISPCGSSVRRTWGSFTGDPEGYERKALEAGISLHRSPAGEHGRHLIYQGLCKMNEGGHWKWSISLCGSSMRNLEEGSFTGDPEGYANKVLEIGVCFHKGPILGNMERVCFRGLLRDRWRALKKDHLLLI